MALGYEALVDGNPHRDHRFFFERKGILMTQEHHHTPKHTIKSAYLQARVDFHACGMPSDTDLLAAFYRLNDFLRQDPVLACAYVTLDIGGAGGD